MLTPVGCLSCSCAIGHVAQIFRWIRRQRVEKALAAAPGQPVLPTAAALDTSIVVEMKDVLEALGIEFDCCRMHLGCAQVMSDFY